MQLRWKLKYPAALQYKSRGIPIRTKERPIGFYRVQVLCMFRKKSVTKNKISTIFASSEG